MTGRKQRGSSGESGRGETVNLLEESEAEFGSGSSDDSSKRPSDKSEAEPGDPSDDPSGDPSNDPSGDSSDDLSEDQSEGPSRDPSDDPSGQLSDDPSGDPSDDPPKQLSDDPSGDPSEHPSEGPFDPNENWREHDVLGECPWYHSVDSDCTCLCAGCGPRVRQRPRLLRRMWDDGEFDTAGRVGFSPPPAPRPRGITRQPITRLPPDVMSIVSHYNGDFDEPETPEAFPVDAKSHHALTFALGQKPCTERIPWKTRVAYWDAPCPNDRRQVGLNDLYLGHIEACQTSSRRCPSPGEVDEPGPPDTPDGRRYVCEEHIEDSKKFYEEEKLFKAHLVGTCRDHMRKIIDMYPYGYNSCTCRNLLNKWQCRLCYRKKVLKLENHFRRRVLAQHHGGGGDRDMLHHVEYYLDWKEVRRMLVRDHPCNHQCGNKRVLNNYKDCLVMDCRACGTYHLNFLLPDTDLAQVARHISGRDSQYETLCNC